MKGQSDLSSGGGYPVWLMDSDFGWKARLGLIKPTLAWTMKGRKRLIGFLAICLLCASLSVFPASAAQGSAKLVPFYSTPPGGTGYILTAGAVAVSNKHLTGVTFVHQATTGTLEMVRNLMAAESQKKDAFGCFGQSDAVNAYRGEAEYEGRAFPGLRSIVFNMFGDLYLVVPANSSIKSYGDVRGKRIGMGGPGGTVGVTGLLIFEEYSITKSDFKPYYYVFKEIVEGIQDGSLDGGFLSGAYPVSAYLELSARANVRIVPLDEKIIDKIIARRPGHFKAILKAKSYKGVEQDTPIIQLSTAFYTHAAVGSDLVYRFVKNLFDHKEEYYAVHRDARAMTKENVINTVAVPFHPGAEKYLKEIGAIK